MYTVKIVDKSVQRNIRQFVVAVEFNNSIDTFTNKFNFGFDTDLDTVMRTIKQYANALNTLEQSVDLVPTGDVDLDAVTEPTPTADEVAFSEWLTDYNRMRQVQELIDLGVIPAANPKVTALRNKLQTNLKAEYIDKL